MACVEIGTERMVRAHLETPGRQGLEHPDLRLHALREALAHAIGAELQRPQPGQVDLVNLAQGARGGVSGIDEGLVAACPPGGVEALEVADREHHLTPDRDRIRDRNPRVIELQRDAQQLLQVRGHVLAHAAVAPGGADAQQSSLVHQLDAGAVELRLDREGDGALPVEHPADPLVEAPQLVGVHGVVEGQHGDAMGDAREALAGWSPDSLGRRVGQPKLGMGLLQALELPEQAIVLGVADLG